MSEDTYNDEVIRQNHERGPGWFLKISYIVVTLFCLYYLFTFWDWKSSYEVQQEQLQQQMKK